MRFIGHRRRITAPHLSWGTKCRTMGQTQYVLITANSAATRIDNARSPMVNRYHRSMHSCMLAGYMLLTEFSFSASNSGGSHCFLGYRLVASADRGADGVAVAGTRNFLVPATSAVHNGVYVNWHSADTKAGDLSGSGGYHIVRMASQAGEVNAADAPSTTRHTCSICMVEGE